MPLCASSSDYCAAVRKPLHLPTTDAVVPLVFGLPPPPLVSLLKHVAEFEAKRAGRAINGYLTLERSLNHIQRHGVGGLSFTAPTVSDVNDLTTRRNRYLHIANDFPADTEIRVFLSKTVQAISEAITFRA
jgi:hypothetical protein